MLTPEWFKETFTALVLHFTTNYDYVKYQGRLKNRNVEAPGSALFTNLGKRFRNKNDFKFHMIANIVRMYPSKPTMFIGDYLDKESFAYTKQFENYYQSLAYQTKETLERVHVPVKKLVIVDEKNGCLLFKKTLTNEIHPLIMLAFSQIWELLDYWQDANKDDPLFADMIQWYRKLSLIITMSDEKKSVVKKEIMEFGMNFDYA